MTARNTETIRLGIWPGEGIGPEIAGQAREVVNAATGRYGVAVEWIPVILGAEGLASDGQIVPDASLSALANCHGWIMGPYDDALYPDDGQRRRNPSAELRRQFDLFANIRPSKWRRDGRSGPLDVIIVRENTEGFYADRNMVSGPGELMPVPGVVLSVGLFTRRAAGRVAEVACELAHTRSGRLTIAHKANVLPLGMGLFRDACREVASEHSSLTVDEIHLDALASSLVERPEAFDVLVMENMAGDIMSNLTAALTTGLGAAGSLNAGDQRAMAQASHGSAPMLAGKNLANPIGIILSSGSLLRWIAGQHDIQALGDAATAIENSVQEVLAAGETTTDLGGASSTEGVGQAIIDKIR